MLPLFQFHKSYFMYLNINTLKYTDFYINHRHEHGTFPCFMNGVCVCPISSQNKDRFFSLKSIHRLAFVMEEQFLP